MIWLCLIICLLLIPAVVGFVYDWNLNYGITITTFSAISVSHFILQLVFATLERRRVKTYPPPSSTQRNIGIQITGWKEDAALFEKCLISIAKQNLQPTIVTFCSDGNDKDDEYLVTLFQKVFPSSCVLRLSTTIQPETDLSVYTTVLADQTRICLTQPHQGKRHAMYSQTKLLLALGMEFLLFVDSDTILHPEGLEHLVSSMEATQADAVTGDVRIYNLDNLLSFLVALKYWFAFSIERASQSYFGNVSCISGPFGFYRCSTLATLIDKWKQQTFWGKECTFGDDRHLTNLILKQGGKAYFDWRGVCFTDTPTTLRRFITQQTRWAKSFIREYLVNFGWFDRKQLWLLYDLSFMTTYSLLLTAYIVFLFIHFNYTANILFFNAVLGATLVRALYAVWITGDWKHLVFTLYSYIYIFVLIPIKLWALVTLNKTSWGTGSRLAKTSKYVDLCIVSAWMLFLIVCFGISLGYVIQDGFSILDIIFSTTIVCVTLCAYGYYLYISPRLSNELLEVLEHNQT